MGHRTARLNGLGGVQSSAVCGRRAHQRNGDRTGQLIAGFGCEPARGMPAPAALRPAMAPIPAPTPVVFMTVPTSVVLSVSPLIWPSLSVLSPPPVPALVGMASNFAV